MKLRSLIFFTAIFFATNIFAAQSCLLNKSVRVKYGRKTFYFCTKSAAQEFSKNPKLELATLKQFKLRAHRYSFGVKKITVKKGDQVHLIVHAADVTHGVFLKPFSIKVTVAVGQPKLITFVADKVGSFTLRCSVYCGSGHRTMHFPFIVLDK